MLGFGGEPAVIQVTPLEGVPDESGKASEDQEAVASGGRGRSGRPRGRGRGRRQRQPVSEVGTESEGAGAEPGPSGADERSLAPAEGEDLEPADQQPARDEPGAADEEERQPGPDPRAEELATEILDYFLGTMGVVASTYIREDTSDGEVSFEIEGEDAGLLIGRHGETLHALQFLVNILINKQLSSPTYVTIDVEGYRERHHESLRVIANRAASRVSSSGESQTLRPMSAADRRIIHVTLVDHPAVRTESKGEGDQRRVVVLPDK